MPDALKQVFAVTPAVGRQLQTHLPLVLALGMLMVLYLPTGLDLFRTLWATDQNGHGPLVLGVAGWLLWRKVQDEGLTAALYRAPSFSIGWAGLAVGFACYWLGRSQGLAFLEVGSLVILLASLVLVFFGRAVLARLWFPLFMMLFAVPLPGSVIDTLTQPMKILASVGAEQLLYLLRYPVARQGVTLSIGPYQLLVADACAGLNSLLTLEALGLLYLNLVRHPSVGRTLLLAIAIVPISLAANAIRVVVLALITFHFGDAAGQGFAHGFAGMVLFITALLLIMSADAIVRLLLGLWTLGRKAHVAS